MKPDHFHSRAIFLCAALLLAPAARPQEVARSAAGLSSQDKEQFLRTAKVVRSRGISKGITGTVRVTLSDGRVTHDAHIQSVDITKPEFRTDRGVELNFRDSYKFNIAAYRLARLLGLSHMTPVSVERKVAGKTSAITWWVDDVLMDESTRLKKKIDAPDPAAWNAQMHVVNVFDQLIYNTDRNLQNLLITRDWKLEMIDHSRAFRLATTLRQPEKLVRCERTLLKRMRELDEETLMRELRPYLRSMEIRALLARRDAIVQAFEAGIAAKGEAAVLYDFPAMQAAAN
jgi:hypothetical protein